MIIKNVVLSKQNFVLEICIYLEVWIVLFSKLDLKESQNLIEDRFWERDDAILFLYFFFIVIIFAKFYIQKDFANHFDIKTYSV